MMLQRNRFIVEATEQALQRAQLARVLEELRKSSAWKDEDHPDLATLDGVDNYVRALRDNWMSAEMDSSEASLIPPMPNFLLDTNILILALRKHDLYAMQR